MSCVDDTFAWFDAQIDALIDKKLGNPPPPSTWEEFKEGVLSTWDKLLERLYDCFSAWAASYDSARNIILGRFQDGIITGEQAREQLKALGRQVAESVSKS